MSTRNEMYQHPHLPLWPLLIFIVAASVVALLLLAPPATRFPKDLPEMGRKETVVEGYGGARRVAIEWQKQPLGGCLVRMIEEMRVGYTWKFRQELAKYPDEDPCSTDLFGEMLRFLEANTEIEKAFMDALWLTLQAIRLSLL